MNKFAKLYETDLGQILVMLDSNEDFNPEVKIYFTTAITGVCSIAFRNSDSEEDWDDMEQLFDKVDESLAYNAVNEIVEKLMEGEG